MAEEKVLLSRSSLCERWDFKSEQSLINYENDGTLTRNPNFKVPRYYMEEIIQIEALKEINPLSPLERRRLEKKVADLERENEMLKSKLVDIKVLLA